MSLNLLKTTLDRLSSPAIDSQTRTRILKDSFILFEQHTNTSNLQVLVRAFLASSLFVSSDPISVSYAVTDSARFLSSDRATDLSGPVLKSLRSSTGTSSWSKAIFLSSLHVAEFRGAPGPPAWYSTHGRYASPYISHLNAAVRENACTMGMKAGLLISLSWIWPTLTSYLRSKISDSTIQGLLEGLYKSNLILASNDVTPENNRGFKELGLLTRTVAELVDSSVPACKLSMIETLHDFSSDLGSRLNSQPVAVKQTLFLSVITILQSLMPAAVRYDLSVTDKRDHARTTLKILRNLEGIHADSSVFEPWRFCFQLSLDLLADDSTGLTEYLNELLSKSLLSEFPLSSELYTGLYSLRRDREDILWLLLVTEASASAITSEKTRARVFEYCYSQLTSSSQQDTQIIEWLHSVLISFFSSHTKQFAKYMTGYAKHVLAKDGKIDDRQFKLIFKTLYRVSLLPQVENGSEDPRNILALLKSGIATSELHEQKSKLLSTYIDLLPIIPAQFLSRNLQHVMGLLNSKDFGKQIDAQFVEVCTTEMDSERAILCVPVLDSQSRGTKVIEKAKL